MTGSGLPRKHTEDPLVGTPLKKTHTVLSESKDQPSHLRCSCGSHYSSHLTEKKSDMTISLGKFVCSPYIENKRNKINCKKKSDGEARMSIFKAVTGSV